MNYDNGTTVVNKRMSFLSVTAAGVTFILVTAIICGTGLVVYAVRVIDRKTDNIAGLVKETVHALPEIRAALPPALADAIDDVRRPDYLPNLTIKTQLRRNSTGRHHNAVIEIVNNGDEMVSLLSMRVIGLDKDGIPTVERCTWAATPLQIEDDWRGPLLPHETRKMVVRLWEPDSVASIEVEITDIRLWRGAPKTQEESL